MKRVLLIAALALSAMVAHAKSDPKDPPVNSYLPTCSITADVQMDAINCYGVQGANTNGNPATKTAVLTGLNTYFGTPPQPWSEVTGQTDITFGGSDGSDTLSFNTLMKGFFAVALKAGNGYNMYLFDAGATGVSSISYTIAKDLSHANLYTFSQSDTYGCGAVCAPVPEPTTYALMLAGLAALGFVSMRRKTA